MEKVSIHGLNREVLRGDSSPGLDAVGALQLPLYARVSFRVCAVREGAWESAAVDTDA